MSARGFRPATLGAKIVFMHTEEATAPARKRDPEAVALGERIKGARGTVPMRVLAETMDVHENTLGKWERGETVPSALQLQKLARELGKKIDFFLAQPDGGLFVIEAKSYAPPAPTAHAVRQGSLIYVPLFDLRQSTGADAFGDPKQVRRMHAFLDAYLTEDLEITHLDLVLVQMASSAAEPDIHAGALVLVDLQDKTVQLEGPHLVRMDQAMFIKMLRRRPGRILVSNNSISQVGAFEVDPNGADAEHFEVLGRCRWAGFSLT